MLTADLLLAFDDEGQVAGQFSPGFQIRFHGVQVREVLALVITRPAAEQGALIDARLKRRRGPQFEWLGGLDVVVAIDEITGPLRTMRSFRDDDGVAAGAAD